MDNESNSIVNGDARSVLNDVESESVHLTVTSPPYNLDIDYGSEESDARSLKEWTDLIREVIEQIYRVTVPDGKFCVVVGSSFGESEDERYRRVSLRRRIIDTAVGAGFDLFDEIVWQKHRFHANGDSPLFGSYPYPTNLPIAQQHEYILTFRKPLPSPNADRPDIPPIDSKRRERSKLRREDWRSWTQSVWHVEAGQISETHRAAFPVEIPRRLIRLYSFAGDTVLDPFIGTGTTAVAARKTGRSYIGIERSAELASQARQRIAGELESVAECSEDNSQPPEIAPEEIPDYVADGIGRQDPRTLRAISGYASRLATKRERESLSELEQTISGDESIVDIARDDEGTVVEKLVPCGDDCEGCPHGPYRYRVFRDDGELRTEYLGTIESDT